MLFLPDLTIYCITCNTFLIFDNFVIPNKRAKHLSFKILNKKKILFKTCYWIILNSLLHVIRVNKIFNNFYITENKSYRIVLFANST